MERLNLEKTNVLEMVTTEFVAYLASLKSVNSETLTNCGEFAEEVEELLEKFVTFENERLLNPVEENEKLAELLTNGYKVLNVENNLLRVAKEKNATLETLVAKLKEEVRPYRTVFLNLQRMKPEFAKAVVEAALNHK